MCVCTQGYIQQRNIPPLSIIPPYSMDCIIMEGKDGTKYKCQKKGENQFFIMKMVNMVIERELTVGVHVLQQI